MQRRTLTKNRFTTHLYAPQDDENIVFISYRRTVCDQYEARKCAEILEEIEGLHYWLDEDDECMQQAHGENDDLKKALCIEQGLDVSSALLGIIGPGTFDSPWIPYEIGGARGRQRYQPFQNDLPHPLIAHLIHDVELRKVPAFVGLGVPLTSLDEVETWAGIVADIFGRRRLPNKAQSLLDIYKRNSYYLKPT